jgi:hypothetical protein
MSSPPLLQAKSDDGLNPLAQNFALAQLAAHGYGAGNPAALHSVRPENTPSSPDFRGPELRQDAIDTRWPCSSWRYTILPMPVGTGPVMMALQDHVSTRRGPVASPQAAKKKPRTDAGTLPVAVSTVTNNYNLFKLGIKSIAVYKNVGFC